MDRKEIVYRLARGFDDIGIPGLRMEQAPMSAHQPVEIDLVFGEKGVRLLCEVKSDARSITVERAISQLERWMEHKGGKVGVPCLVVPFLPESTRSRLRSRNISFIDLSGNIRISVPGVFHIEREGKANKFSDQQISRNIFADKRTLVLRYLFANPKKFVGVREIANACGVNPGGVSVALRLLEDAGYVARTHHGKSKLVSWRELLEDWASHCKLKKQSESKFFWNTQSLDRMLDLLADHPLHGFALTGHAGAHLVAPHVNYEGLHAYVENREVVDELVRALKMRPAERGANVFLLQAYYRESVFFGARNIRGIKVVSDVQLYLDLKNFPVRGEEQAENLLRRVIAPAME